MYMYRISRIILIYILGWYHSLSLCEVDVEFLKDLLENAVSLEKMIIDPCKSHFMGSPVMWYCRRSEGYKSARKCAIELAEKFPHVEFVIPEIFVPLADR